MNDQNILKSERLKYIIKFCILILNASSLIKKLMKDKNKKKFRNTI